MEILYCMSIFIAIDCVFLERDVQYRARFVYFETNQTGFNTLHRLPLDLETPLKRDSEIAK